MKHYCGIDHDLLYTTIMFHDLGTMVNREEHHLHSSKMVYMDNSLPLWFNSDNIITIATACYEHRNSLNFRNLERTIYSAILSDSDRLESYTYLDVEETITRMIFRVRGYNKGQEPDENKLCELVYSHIHKKFGKNGPKLILNLSKEKYGKVVKEVASKLEDKAGFTRFYFDLL